MLATGAIADLVNASGGEAHSVTGLQEY